MLYTLCVWYIRTGRTASGLLGLTLLQPAWNGVESIHNGELYCNWPIEFNITKHHHQQPSHPPSISTLLPISFKK